MRSAPRADLSSASQTTIWATPTPLGVTVGLTVACRGAAQASPPCQRVGTLCGSCGRSTRPTGSRRVPPQLRSKSCQGSQPAHYAHIAKLWSPCGSMPVNAADAAPVTLRLSRIVGGVVGVAGIRALLQKLVASDLKNSLSSIPLGERPHFTYDVVLAQAGHYLPGADAFDAVVLETRAAFANAFSLSLLVMSLLMAVGAVIALLLVRRTVSPLPHKGSADVYAEVAHDHR